LAAAAPAFASLAVAVLRSPDTDDDCKRAVVVVTGVLCTCIDVEVAAAKAAAKQAGDPHATNKLLDVALGGELLASADFAVLLAAYSAMCLQHLQDTADGQTLGDPASATNTAAAAGVEADAEAAADARAANSCSKLLRVLGVPGDIPVPSSYRNKNMWQLLQFSCTAAQQVVAFAGRIATCRARSRCSSEDLSKLTDQYGPMLDRMRDSAAQQQYERQQQQQQQLQQALPLELVAAWVPVLIELTLLMPAEHKAHPCMVAGCLLETARSLATTEAYGLEGVAALDASNRQLFQLVLQVLLQVLLPDIWQALKSSKAWKARDSSGSSRSSSSGSIFDSVERAVAEKGPWPLALEGSLQWMVMETFRSGK
jgi:hypothetical protein